MNQKIANNENLYVTSMDMYNLYKNGQGKDVTLSQLGLIETIKKSVEKSTKTTGGKGTIQERFLNQLKSGGSTYFKRSYDFESDVFAIGSATVSGVFNGTITETEDGKKHIEGIITYSFLINLLILMILLM